jgi:hypothetical protein
VNPDIIAHLHSGDQNAQMEYCVSYEHSLAADPNDFVVLVPSQLVDDVPANVPRALLPEFIAELIKQRSPQIGRKRPGTPP